MPAPALAALVPAALFLAAVPARAQLDEASIRITPLDGRPAASAAPLPAAGAAALVNAGLKLWAVVKDNAPVVDVRTAYATALPEGATSWTLLEGWRPPEGRLYGLSAQDVYGRSVVDVRYKVLRTWGGSLAGKGRYLTGVAIIPVRVEAAWGYALDLEAFVPEGGLVNAGTAADPVAGLSVALAWRIRTPLKDSRGRGVYYVQGDGLFRELAGPFAALDGAPEETLP